MIEIPRNDNYGEVMERLGNGDHYPCIICGRSVRKPRHWGHVHNGGGHLVTEEEAAVLDARDREQHCSGDLGFYPIGPECLRLHPELRPYIVSAPL